jgi:hypothetical protein
MPRAYMRKGTGCSPMPFTQNRSAATALNRRNP